MHEGYCLKLLKCRDAASAYSMSAVAAAALSFYHGVCVSPSCSNPRGKRATTPAPRVFLIGPQVITGIGCK